MNEVFTWLGPIAMAAVLLVLFLGLWNMMRGGSASRSQTLMRWRVGLQFLAIVVIMAGLYLSTL
ncbi:MAG: twin transmembrane helix small protein [Parvibaculum sp.]|uniref:twin transmembrane helix small protein n=1 Tax=Parvibaculum sp. TaxID=2024848 RepID=UPI00326591A7